MLTEALKDFAVANLGVAADATDDAFKAAINAALKDGKLTAEKYAELLTVKQQDPAEIIAKAVAAAMAPVVGEIKSALATKSEPTHEVPPAQTGELDAHTKAFIEAEVAKMRDAGLPEAKATKLIAKAGDPRIKSVEEMYDCRRKELIVPERNSKGAKNANAGRRAMVFGKGLDEPSQLDMAICGAYAKWALHSSMGIDPLTKMSDHEVDLVMYALNKREWRGVVGCNGNPDSGMTVDGKLTDAQRKAVINDGTSGGTYAVPDVFDDSVLQTPVLEGELFPLVDVVNLNQGASVAGFTVGHVSLTSNHTEGSPLALLSTSGLIANLDTTIFPVVGAIELGLDWESDTPVNFGKVFTQDYGVKLKEWLDTQIAIGDGTTEPLGIFTASGTTTVSHAGGTSAAFTINDFEKLMWGLSKVMRQSMGGKCVFVTKDSMYRRARAIPVGTEDVRRALGMDHEAYTIMERSVRINESISEGSIAYWNPAYYRMFRRLGSRIEVVTGGQTLALKNTRLIVFRARYGGQPRLGASICKMTDGPATG